MANRGQGARQAADPVNRLAELLEGALQMNAPRDRFKAPRYDGKGDVELFIAQFQEIAQANQWDVGTSLISLRLALEKDAVECSRGQDI